MKRLVTFILFLSALVNTRAQDFNCQVKVIHPKIQISNTQIFTSLENSISQFINQRKWSNDKITVQERFQMNLLIDVTEYALNSNEFKATIQVQAVRPVYGSTYSTVVFNQLDEDFNFQYQEFQAMEFQENNNVSNLTGVLAFYAYIVMGLDYDTYSLEGGTQYFQKAQGILNASQGIGGWRNNDGRTQKNRYYIIDNITSDRYKPLRKCYYDYHIGGLDMMYKDVVKGRASIAAAVTNFQELARVFPNSMMIKVFFNAKQRELVEIFKEAPQAEKLKMIELLSKMDPANKNNYEKIRG